MTPLLKICCENCNEFKIEVGGLKCCAIPYRLCDYQSKDKIQFERYEFYMCRREEE